MSVCLSPLFFGFLSFHVNVNQKVFLKKITDYEAIRLLGGSPGQKFSIFDQHAANLDFCGCDMTNDLDIYHHFQGDTNIILGETGDVTVDLHLGMERVYQILISHAMFHCHKNHFKHPENIHMFDERVSQTASQIARGIARNEFPKLLEHLLEFLRHGDPLHWPTWESYLAEQIKNA